MLHAAPAFAKPRGMFDLFQYLRGVIVALLAEAEAPIVETSLGVYGRSNHAPPANVGKLRIASIRKTDEEKPSRRTKHDGHPCREGQGPSLALGLFNA